jgi:hypothetical protein
MTPISKELDNLCEEVLEVLGSTTPPRNYTSAVKSLFSRYSLKVTADNLRAWHVRRVALSVVESIAPDVRCRIDDYAEAIMVWRDPELRLNWATISAMLAAPAPNGFEFAVSEQALRNWWHRRKLLGEKRAAGLAAVRAGLPQASMPQAYPVPAPKAELDCQIVGAVPVAPTNTKAINGENDIQRKIRLSNQLKDANSQAQDKLLASLESKQKVTP